MKNLYTILFSFILLNCFAQAPVMNSISGQAAFCANVNSSFSYTASAGNSPLFYNWQISPIGATLHYDSTSVILIDFPNTPGTYTISCSATNNSGSSPYLNYVVTIFETPEVSFSGANSFCQGSSTNLSASSTIQGASSTVSYNWAPSFGLNTTTGPHVIASPSVSTTYSVTASNGVCSNTGTLVVAPFESLSVTFSGANTFCQGSSTNLSASSTIQGASSTVFYSWSPSYGLNTIYGPNVIANPSVSTTYTVTSYYQTCSNTGQITVGPNGLLAPTINASVNHSVVCYGDSVILSASGASTYTWSNAVQNGISFNVYNTDTYYVYGTDVNGCVGTGSVDITVSPNPYFSIYSDLNPIPPGSGLSSHLTIYGSAGSTYSLNGVPTSTAIVLSPTVTTTYTFTSDNAAGCSYTQIFTLYVEYVLGINTQVEVSNNYVKAYPNPNYGSFIIKSGLDEKIEIINQLGETVKFINLKADEEQQIVDLSSGIYIIKSNSKRIKLIVTR